VAEAINWQALKAPAQMLSISIVVYRYQPNIGAADAKRGTKSHMGESMLIK
jgi:hypothetical protein